MGELINIVLAEIAGLLRACIRIKERSRCSYKYRGTFSLWTV